MRMKVLAENVKTVAATPAVEMKESPFTGKGGAAGRKALLVMLTEETDAAAADQVGNVEGSNDGSTGWTVVQAYSMVTGGQKMVYIDLWPYMRVNNTGGTSGATSFYLQN